MTIIGVDVTIRSTLYRYAIQSPQNTGRFLWTNHAARKIIYYGLSEQKISRIINYPR